MGKKDLLYLLIIICFAGGSYLYIMDIRTEQANYCYRMFKIFNDALLQEDLVISENTSLELDLIGTLEFGLTRVSCSEFLEIRLHRNPHNLFNNGMPECVNEEVPDAWVESKKSINKNGVTVCAIPCAVFQMPFKGGLNGNYLGHIKGSQNIFVKDVIKIIKEHDRVNPWDREWISFEYNGDIYYTSNQNVRFD